MKRFMYLTFALLMLISSFVTPISAANDVGEIACECTEEHTHETEYMHIAEVNDDVTLSGNLWCDLFGHDFTGTINFYGVYVFHNWNNTFQCVRIAYKNVSCTRSNCPWSKDFHEIPEPFYCPTHK